ncbi:sulfite exporter TauE/SafE family protein [Candidatus Zixiibacteriota bacterium]
MTIATNLFLLEYLSVDNSIWLYYTVRIWIERIEEMTQDLTALVITAASIGFVHTLLGPDHYLPFVAMAKARDWSTLRTLIVTVICGIGHVASSVVLGLIGVAAGIAVTKLEAVESVRGDLAAWALIAFGLVYLVWGIRRAVRNVGHKHFPGLSHHHHETNESGHPREQAAKPSITPWVLFTVFVLGPCEPLIPILMYPAAQSSTSGMILVAAVFSLVTISTMVGAVFVLCRGIKLVSLRSMERYSHALAGFVILLCGVAIRMGL